jgi:hypothetical protein
VNVILISYSRSQKNIERTFKDTLNNKRYLPLRSLSYSLFIIIFSWHSTLHRLTNATERASLNNLRKGHKTPPQETPRSSIKPDSATRLYRTKCKLQIMNTHCQVTRVFKKCLVMQYCASLTNESLLYLRSTVVLVLAIEAVPVHTNISFLTSLW